jgi:6-phosphogluconolactonase (cycloisomerase 2 family)
MVFKSLAIMALVAGAPLHAQTAPLLIGTYTAGESKGIYLYTFDSATGAISARPAQVMPAENPSWLTLSADRRFLYAVNENSEGQRDPVGRVSAYRVAPGTGRLTFVNRTASLGSDPTFSSLSKDGRTLFVANYSVLADPGGTLAVVPVLPDGALGPVVQVKTHRASLANAERQGSPHVHSAVSSPDGRYVFAQDLGADRIYVYRYDPANREAPLSAMKEQPFVTLPAGSGPRHLVFSADGKHAYLTLEMVGQVAAFDYADGRLTLRQTLPLAAADFHGALGAGALHLSPDGRFLYATDRGTDNQLVTFAIAPDTGALTFVARRSVEGQEPREFTFDPTGRFVLVANQHSHAVVVFRRDPATGLIGEKVHSLSIDQASDVKFPK